MEPVFDFIAAKLTQGTRKRNKKQRLDLMFDV